MDGPTDGRTDTASYRDARTHLKTWLESFEVQWLNTDRQSTTTIVTTDENARVVKPTEKHYDNKI